MDLDTENRIAAILMRETAELRRQAQKDGVHAYLQQPKVRFKPNSRFLSATVRGVEQANKVVEVNEMWRIREKEQELDERLKGKRKNDGKNDGYSGNYNSPRTTSKRQSVMYDNALATCSSSKRVDETCHSREENGLRDEELEEFLHSRVKRGRGAVGPRMDETGPYLPHSESKDQLIAGPSVQERRVYGPQKPSQRLYDSSEEELDNDRKKSKKARLGSSKKHKSKDKSKEQKKKQRKEEKRSKYCD